MGFTSRLVLMRPKAGRDAGGQPTKGWDDVEEIWADLSGKGGRVAVSADARTAVVGSPIRIRRRADVVAGWALPEGAAVYRVLAVPPAGADLVNMTLVCEAVS